MNLSKKHSHTVYGILLGYCRCSFSTARSRISFACSTLSEIAGDEGGGEH